MRHVRGRGFSAGVVALTALVLAGACDDRPRNESSAASYALAGGQVTLNVPLPPGVPLSNVALAANSTVLIGSNVSVTEEGEPNVHTAIVNAGTGTMSTTQTAVTLGADLWSVGSVFLATGTQVSGGVTTAGALTQQTGVTVAGTIAQHQTLAPVNTSLSITFPSSSTNVTLQPGQSSSLSPGAFASVTVNSNATLTLQSGTYYLDGLDIEPQGKIVLSGAGPFVLDVRTSLALKGQIVVPAVSPAPTFVLVDAGVSDVFLQSEFDGTLIAPNANVTLATIGASSYHGAFVGKSLTLQAGVTVVHRGTSAGTVTPVAECIVTPSSGTSQVVFGYSASSLLGNVTIPVGANNQVLPAPASRGQPQTFSPGRHTAQFMVPFDGHAVAWSLGGVSSTATAVLPPCTAACVQHLTTAGQPRIDTVLTSAASPLSVNESVVQRDAFRWDDTLPVPETFPDGTARMYYGLVYLNSRESVPIMDAVELNYDNVPLFDTETSAYQQQGLTRLSYPFDGQGQFAFALIPGATYNAVRQAALDPTQPTEIFQAVQLRSMPVTDSQLTVQTSCGLAPVAQCVARAANGSLRAVFSYNNPAAQPVTVPIGPDNALTGAPAGTLPPEAFAAGAHTAVFAVPFTSGATVNWHLQSATVSVNAQSATCSSTIVNQIGADVFNPFPAPAPSACRSETPAEAQYPGSHLPPAARINSCNSLSYTYASTLGFTWRGVTSSADDAAAQAAQAALALQDGATNATALVAAGPARLLRPVQRPALFGKLFHKIVQAVVQTGAGAVDLVRRGLNAGVGLFTGATNVSITAAAQNTDAFLTLSGATPMLQAWGKDFGNAISLQGVQVRSSKSIFLSVGDLDAKNTASVKVLNRLGSHICFNLRNDAAQIVDFTTLPVTVCPSGADAQISGSPPGQRTVSIKDVDANVMAQLTDSRKFANNVMSAQIAQAEVLTGAIANGIGALNKDRPFTPCWSFSWANDVANFLTEAGVVIADLADNFAISEIEAGAKYLQRGLTTTVTDTQNLATQLTALAAQAAGTAEATLANQARDAANAALTAVRAAQKTATLAGQDAGDLVGGTATAARLASAASSRASAAANQVQKTVNQVVSDSPTLQKAIADAQAAAQAAQNAANTLAMALPSGSDLSQAAQTALQTAGKVSGAFINYEQIFGKLALDIQKVSLESTFALIGNYLGNTIGQLFEGIATADMIFPAHNSDKAKASRGVGAHEYGHFTLCNLLDNVSPAAFAVMYDEAAAAGFVTGQAASAEGAVLNESFADLMCSQIVGATNYAVFASDHSASPDNLMDYCLTSGTDCIEHNTTNLDPKVQGDFFGEVRRNVTLFTDAFDGRVFPPNADVPANGSAWSTPAGGSGVALSCVAGGACSPGASANDEMVSLKGNSFAAWISHTVGRGNTALREANVFGGLSDTMADQGYNWCQRCRVFKLHTLDQTTNQPICPWAGPRPTYSVPGMTGPLTCTDEGACPAGTTPDPANGTCDPPCPSPQVFDPVQLACVTPIIIG